MTAALADLIAQKEALEQQIASIKKNERVKAIADARAIIDAYDLTSAELFGKKAATGPVGKSTVAPKYRNPETGDTWSGRGRAPKWLEGKNKEDYAI